MKSDQSRPCGLYINYEPEKPPAPSDIQQSIEKGTTEEKVDGLKTLILMVQQDETFPRYLMSVLQYCSTEDDHEMKKTLLLYWEVVEKTNPDGQMKPEMILICNTLLKDLENPNQYVRARTLRLISKLKFRGMLDPLLHAILANLDHTHPYVKRNAVMCVYSIYMSYGDELIPDAPTRIEDLLRKESDLSTRRNALLLLFEADQETALRYIDEVMIGDEESAMFNASADILQLAVLSELKKVCKSNPLDKGKYMKVIYTLANTSKSQSVLFECASTILQLTSLPNAIKRALETYIRLINDQSADNNIKLIVLDKLMEVKNNFPRLLQEQIVDILRVINTPSNDIRKRVINLTLDLLSQRNINDIVRIFKKEIINLQSTRIEENYQRMLLLALHKCAQSFPEITGQHNLVDLLMDYCLIGNAPSEVAMFIQELVVQYESLREAILNRLHNSFSGFQDAHVYRSVLWIMSEYSTDPKQSLDIIFSTIGEPPFIHAKERVQHQADTTEAEIVRTIVLPDGTYGTEIVSNVTQKQGSISGLRKLLTENEEIDFYLVSNLIISVTKLIFKLEDNDAYKTEGILLACNLMKLRSYPRKHIKPNKDTSHCESSYRIDPDSFELISHCIQTLTGTSDPDWLQHGVENFAKTIQKRKQTNVEDEGNKDNDRQPDDLIVIKQLKGREGLTDLDFTEDEDWKSTGFMQRDKEDFATMLTKIRQLTGLGDPLYIECYIKVQQFDIILEFTCINRTDETLQNLTLELASQGNLKIIDRPSPINVGPGQTAYLKAGAKVSSTDAGVIFGNATYDRAAGGNIKVIQLTEMNIDVLEYIQPASCTENEFRDMWSQYSWESKIAVVTELKTLQDYANLIIKKSNMKCVTPESDEMFLTSNLYAKSRFGEDAMANISIEYSTEGKVVGTVRIRAKNEGMAKCLAEKFDSIQKDTS